MRLNILFQSVSLTLAYERSVPDLSVKSLQVDEVEAGNSTSVVSSSPANGTLLWKYAKTAAVVGGVGLAGSMLISGVDSDIAKNVHDALTKSYQGIDIVETTDVGELAAATGRVLDLIYKHSPVPWLMRMNFSKVSSRFYLKRLLLDRCNVHVAGFDNSKFESLPSVADRGVIQSFIRNFEIILTKAFEGARTLDKERALSLSVSKIHPLIVDAFNKGVISAAEGKNIARALYDKVQATITLSAQINEIFSDMLPIARDRLETRLARHLPIDTILVTDGELRYFLNSIHNGACYLIHWDIERCFSMIEPVIRAIDCDNCGFPSMFYSLEKAMDDLISLNEFTSEQIFAIHDESFKRFFNMWTAELRITQNTEQATDLHETLLSTSYDTSVAGIPKGFESLFGDVKRHIYKNLPDQYYERSTLFTDAEVIYFFNTIQAGECLKGHMLYSNCVSTVSSLIQLIQLTRGPFTDFTSSLGKFETQIAVMAFSEMFTREQIWEIHNVAFQKFFVNWKDSLPTNEQVYDPRTLHKIVSDAYKQI